MKISYDPKIGEMFKKYISEHLFSMFILELELPTKYFH